MCQPVYLQRLKLTYPNSELPRQAQNNILRRRPPTQLARKLDTQYLRRLELPRRIDKRIDRIRATNTNDNGSEPTSVRRVTIRPKHHETRSRVVLQHRLMYDTRARRPELDAVFLRCGLEEVEDLFIAFYRLREVGVCAFLALNMPCQRPVPQISSS